MDAWPEERCNDHVVSAIRDAFAVGARRSASQDLRFDEEHVLRVIAHPITFEGFVDQAFGTLAQYCARDMVAALHYLRALGEVSLDLEDPARLGCLSTCAGKLDALAEHALDGFNRSRVHERVREEAFGTSLALAQPSGRLACFTMAPAPAQHARAA